MTILCVDELLPTHFLSGVTCNVCSLLFHIQNCIIPMGVCEALFDIYKGPGLLGYRLYVFSLNGCWWPRLLSAYGFCSHVASDYFPKPTQEQSVVSFFFFFFAGFVMVAYFCLFIQYILCILPCNLCNSSGRIQEKLSESFSAYCPIYSLIFFLSLSHSSPCPFLLLPFFPLFFLSLPQTLDKGGSKVKQNKDWN